MQQTILVIDDDPNNLNLLINYLRQAQFKVLVAESGESGLERVGFIQPDLILLDVMMPGLSGFETCRRLKAHGATRHIPVIFMTALADTIDKVRGFDVGGVDYVTKPVQVEELMARINAHLTIRTLQEQLQRHNEQLEERVQERTAELQTEVEQRKKREQEKDGLLDVVRNQSDQLRRLTTWLAQTQQTKQADLSQTLRTQVESNLNLLKVNLELVDKLYTQLDLSALENGELILQHLNDSLALLKQIQSSVAQVTVSLDASEPRLQNNPLLELSSREQEVLQLVADGKSSPEIADMLHLSVHTVRTYRSRMMKKLNVSDTPALIKLALEHNLR